VPVNHTSDADFEAARSPVLAPTRSGSVDLLVDVVAMADGRGPSREHAAIVPRHLGRRAVLATSLARIHRTNLLNFAVPPLTFVYPADDDRIEPGDILAIEDPPAALDRSPTIDVQNEARGDSYLLRHGPTTRQAVNEGTPSPWLLRSNLVGFPRGPRTCRRAYFGHVRKGYLTVRRREADP
jgi:hypothetical protein